MAARTGPAEETSSVRAWTGSARNYARTAVWIALDQRELPEFARRASCGRFELVSRWRRCCETARLIELGSSWKLAQAKAKELRTAAGRVVARCSRTHRPADAVARDRFGERNGAGWRCGCSGGLFDKRRLGGVRVLGPGRHAVRQRDDAPGSGDQQDSVIPGGAEVAGRVGVDVAAPPTRQCHRAIVSSSAPRAMANVGKRIMIVAVARRLVIALWRYLDAWRECRRVRELCRRSREDTQRRRRRQQQRHANEDHPPIAVRGQQRERS